MNIVLDFAKPAGKIRALHGVNNGPVAWGANDDLTPYHAEAGFPSTRLHDAHWPCPDVVDVPCIFPIFDADADDPKYYCFTKTDAYLAPIVKNGSRITYRLGTSIECRLRHLIPGGGLENHPPRDYAKWAKICVNIIRHYNDGWANGFHYGLKYFEIWNEPDGIGTWTGTEQQYFELYEIAARALKAHDPSLKVGGPVMGMKSSTLFAPMQPFLAYCRERKLPLDFFAWHVYHESPREMARYAAAARVVLNEYGFTNAESHLTEWHQIAPPGLPDFGPVEKWGTPNPRKVADIRNYFADMRGANGAAFTVSTLLLLQDAHLDMANFYTADTTSPWSMFDEWGIPGKIYYAFVAFNHLTKTPNRVACERQGEAPPEITLCAGLSDDRKTASLLISNFGSTPISLTVRLKHLPLQGTIRAETLAVDATHDLTRISDVTLEPGASLLTLKIPGDAVYLVRLCLAGK